MTRDEELEVIQHRINADAMLIWNNLQRRASVLYSDLEHVRITTVAIFVVTGYEPGKADQRIHAVATAADASIPSEQIDMILEEASAVRADEVVKEVTPN